MRGKWTLLGGAAIALVVGAWSVNAFWNPSQKYYVVDGDNDADRQELADVRWHAVWEGESDPAPPMPIKCTHLIRRMN